MLRERKYDSTKELFPIPFKGPYQILKLEARDVDLKELKTGDLAQTHIEFIRPISIAEFRLFFNEKLILKRVTTKRVTRSAGSILDEFLFLENPLNPDAILASESKVDSLDEPKDTEPTEPEEPENSDKELESMVSSFMKVTTDSLENLHKSCKGKSKLRVSVEPETLSKKVKFRNLLTKLFE